MKTMYQWIIIAVILFVVLPLAIMGFMDFLKSTEELNTSKQNLDTAIDRNIKAQKELTKTI